MGIVRMGVPEDLVEALRRSLGVKCFVETGTYHGNTARWAASRFERVITIEASPSLHAKARAALGPLGNVEAILGDSRVELARVVPALSSPAICWLDAHWSGGETHGAADECPILDELDIVLGAAAEHVALVDDARLFLAPPPQPHRADQWPGIQELIGLVARRRPDAYTVVVEDVIAIVPPAARRLVERHAQDLATAAWSAAAAPRLRRSARLLVQSARALLGR